MDACQEALVNFGEGPAYGVALSRTGKVTVKYGCDSVMLFLYL